MKSIATVACLAFACAGATGIALASPFQTDEVVVTATRFSTSQQELPIGVAVINADDIRASSARTVPELLMQLPGIRVRDNSGSPNLQVDMRGFGAFGDQNTLVLLDGQRISENEQTPANWSAIPLAAVERIEIIRGGGAVLYGGGATGGTINIITKAPRAGTISGAVGAGIASYNTVTGNASLNAAGPTAGLLANVSYLDTDNYRDHNRLIQRSAQTSARFAGDGGAITLKIGGDSQDLQLPGALTEAQIAVNRRRAATPLDYSSLDDTYANLGAEGQIGGAELAANLGYRSRTARSGFFIGTAFPSLTDTQTTTWNFSPRLRLAHPLGGWRNTLVTGVDWEDWSYDSSTVSSFPGRPSALQRTSAVYLQNTAYVSPAWIVTTGGRLQHVKYGVADPLNAGAAGYRKRNLSAYELAARYRVSDAAALYGKVGYSFRVPNVNDYYNLFTATVTLLEPQTSHDREIGFDFNRAGASYRAALYQMDVVNEIHLDPISFNNVNFPPTRRYGAELAGKWLFTDSVSGFANYTYAVSKFRRGVISGTAIAGNRVPLVPRHAANVGVAWEVLPRTQLNAVLNYIGSQLYDGDETNTFGRKMPAYTLVDLKLVHDNGAWLFSAGVKNLLNEKYFSYGVAAGSTYVAYPAARRVLFTAAQYTFR